MTDPSQPGQPSEEELRAYLEQLREADPAQLVVQAYQMIGAGAEVKLGRPDARVLIDALAGMVDAVGQRLDAELVRQMREGVTQLQMAQVQAERQQGGEPEGGDAQSSQPAGAGEAAGQRPPEPAPPPRTDAAGQRMTDRLWIPGRDPQQ